MDFFDSFDDLTGSFNTVTAGVAALSAMALTTGALLSLSSNEPEKVYKPALKMMLGGMF